MKRFIVIAVFAALVLTACEQKIDIIELPHSSNPVVFTARTESTSTKTALSENGGAYDVVWREGDRITLVDGAATPNVGLYTTTNTTTEATFTFVPESGSEAATAPYKAWYPANIYNDGTPTLPATQQYVEGNIGCAPMFASSNTTELQFKNLGGIICLNLSTSMSEISVSSISLSATQPMSGPISNVASLSSETPVAATVSGSAAVTLDCGAGVAINGTAKPFYIAVPASDYTGLNITVWTTDGKTQTRSLKTDRTVSVSRNSITQITVSFNNFQIQVINLSELEDKNLTIPAGVSAILTGARNDCIVTVEDGATVTLRDATLNQIVIQADATLILDGDNRFKLIDSRDSYNFIQLGSGGHFTIQGTGSLTGSGGGWPGIGCIIGNSDVTLENGNLSLSASNVNAGMTYPSVSVRNLTVTGGSLSAWGGNNYYYNETRNDGIYASNDIVVTGGSVIANGAHGLHAAHNITISDGQVNATGAGDTNNNSGISAGGLLTISGGEVTARGAAASPGIGDRSTCGDILITGGAVTAIGGTGAAAIGTGNASSSVCGSITIRNTVEWVAAFKGEGASEAIGHGHAGSTVGTVTIENGANVSNDYPRTDLSAGGTANSYIVPGKGHYKILATKKGNGGVAVMGLGTDIDAASIVSAKLVWASFGTTMAPQEGELISDIRYENGYLLFSSGNPFKEGNAVVGVTGSDGKLLWSWHLWFTNDDIQTQTYPGGAKMMDRNLGALSATYNADNTEDYGLMYQWGRKDPFLNTCYTGYYNGYHSGSNWGTADLPAVLGTAETRNSRYASIDFLIYTPTEFVYRGRYVSGEGNDNDYNRWVDNMTDDLWGATKTIFDPCPPGWKVPGKDVWDASFVSDFIASDFVDNGFTVGGIRYPSTGHRLVQTYNLYYNGYPNKQANGCGAVERCAEYHVFMWAYDGSLLKELFNLEEYEQYTGYIYSPGVYGYDQIRTMSKIYRNRGGSIRCVKDE